MSVIDIVLLGLIAAALGFAARLWYKNRKEGNACCGNCSGCSGCRK